MELKQEWLKDARQARYLDLAKRAEQNSYRYYGHSLVSDTWRIVADSFRQLAQLTR